MRTVIKKVTFYLNPIIYYYSKKINIFAVLDKMTEGHSRINKGRLHEPK